MSAYTVTEIREAVADHLAAHGLALHLRDGDYPPEPDRPVVFHAALAPAPDLAVAIAVYDRNTAGAGRDIANPDVLVQLRFRGDADVRTVDHWADQAAELLDEAERYVMPGDVRVLQSVRKVTTPASRDGNDRYERFESYQFTLNPKGVTP